MREGPGAWGDLLREQEVLEERGAALKARELPRGVDMVESVQSSEQNDNLNLQEASYVLMAGMMLKERGEWVWKERRMMLRELRVDTAKMAEAIVKLEEEEEVSLYPTL